MKDCINQPLSTYDVAMEQKEASQIKAKEAKTMNRITDSLIDKQDAIHFINTHDLRHASEWEPDPIKEYWVNLCGGDYTDAEIAENEWYWFDYAQNDYFKNLDVSGLTEKEFCAAIFELAEIKY